MAKGKSTSQTKRNKYQSHKSEGTAIKNKISRLKKQIKHNPNDLQAQKDLKRLVA